jgi:hypothetical protein
MKIQKSEKDENTLIIADEILVRLCDETNKILSVEFPKNYLENLEDEIKWMVIEYLDARSECLAFGNNVWTEANPKWEF